MPRASSRSSPSASVSSCWAASSSSFARSGSSWTLPWASRRVSESATSRCWAPSCRLRSSRRRSSRAGLDDPRARGAQLLDAGAQLGLQALVLHRQAGGGGHRAQQLGVLAQRQVVHDGADAAALELDRGPRAARVVARAARPCGPRSRPTCPCPRARRRAGASGRRARRRAGSAACRCRAPRRAAAAARRPRPRAPRGCARGRSGTPTAPRRRRAGWPSPARR